MKFGASGAKAIHVLTAGAAAAVGLAAHGGEAAAQFVGAPRPGQSGLPEPATAIMREMVFFHDAILLPIIAAISLLVLGLLIWVCFKFNDNANQTPSRTTHHTGLEVAWTVVPVAVLMIIAIPSFRLLNNQLTMPDADMTVKVTGLASWAWTWTYPKEEGGGFEFTSRLLDQTNLPEGKLRLLDVDYEAVLPVSKTVRLQVTSEVVGIIHGFAMPTSASASTPFQGVLMKPGFAPKRKASIMGNAPNCAARTTRICRPSSGSSASKRTGPGWKTLASSSLLPPGQSKSQRCLTDPEFSSRPVF